MQAYTLYCCQDVRGGLKDKPTKGPDPYHTMYALAGCSIAQYKSDYENLHAETDKARNFAKNFNGNYHNSLPEDATSEERDKVDIEKTSALGGILDNLLRRINPIYNIRYDYVNKAKAFYQS